MPTIRKRPKIKRGRNNPMSRMKLEESHAPANQQPPTSDERQTGASADVEFTYLSDGNKDALNSLGGLLRQLHKETARKGGGLTFILTRHSDTRWTVEDRSSPFDVPLILKAKAVASKGATDSISRIVPVTRHAPEASQSHFVLTAEIITLRWSIDDAPAYSPHSRWAVGDGSSEETIKAFLNAPALLNKEASHAAKAEGRKEWLEAKEERQRLIRQVRCQMPIAKSVFGVGAGEELRRIALVKPQQRVRLAKKNPNALSRDDVIDRLWDEAFRLGLPRPQRVKI